jgi:DNA-binding Lrp family transcriptional regulator
MHTLLHSKKSWWPESIKNEARLLRKQGRSYGELIKILNVSRSTLFTWIGGMKRPGYITKRDMQLHMKRIQKMAVEANRKIREERLSKIINRVRKEVSAFSLSNKGCLKSMLAMLYWAEGSKGRGALVFANTDPKLSLLFLTMLRKAYLIDEEKLRIRLHLHSYHNVAKTKLFWSTLLGISESKFGKIYIKERSKTKKFRENFAGICFIKYHCEDLRYEILQVADQIANKIAPVA